MTLVLGKTEGQTRDGEGQGIPPKQECLSLKGEGGAAQVQSFMSQNHHRLQKQVNPCGREE